MRGQLEVLAWIKGKAWHVVENGELSTWCRAEHFRGWPEWACSGWPVVRAWRDLEFILEATWNWWRVLLWSIHRPFILGECYSSSTTEMACRSRKPVRSLTELYGKGQWGFELLSQLICTWGIQSQICCSGIYLLAMWADQDGLSKAWVIMKPLQDGRNRLVSEWGSWDIFSFATLLEHCLPLDTDLPKLTCEALVWELAMIEHGGFGYWGTVMILSSKKWGRRKAFCSSQVRGPVACCETFWIGMSFLFFFVYSLEWWGKVRGQLFRGLSLLEAEFQNLLCLEMGFPVQWLFDSVF